MTIEQRLEQVEQQNQKIQRTNKRLTVALTMTVVAMCAVVTMAATGLKDGNFDTVVARDIWVKNDAGEIVVVLGADDDGHGLIFTKSAKGKTLVDLGSSVTEKGIVTTYQPNGKKLVMLGATDDGGGVVVFNKTGEFIVEMSADEYGNGLIGAYNRKGNGRTLKPGP
jgi:hypothetical protein